MSQVLVIGHKNPDNDSICSAVAYAHLKNVTDPQNVYVPARLGPMPPETTWVFDRFGVAEPEEIAHVRTRVRDIMTTGVITVRPEELVVKAGRLMRENNVRALPVTSDNCKLEGLFTMQSLADRYISDLDEKGFGTSPIRLRQLVSTLAGTIVHGDESMELAGNVFIGAMRPETLQGIVEKGDIVVVGDRRTSQIGALEAGACCLVVTRGFTPEADVVELAKSKAAAVVVTQHDTYAAARLVNLSHEVRQVMETDTLMVEPETLVQEVSDVLFNSLRREALVVDTESCLVGIVTRTNLALVEPRNVILVDHNERSQSAEGIEEAGVVEIVDHHRIGDVETTGPIMFLNLPVGSTATIVARRYRELGVDVPKPMAGLMLSAILSDTVILKSPTATDVDRETVQWLSGVVGVEYVAFGTEMHHARAAGREMSVENIVGADLKEYRVGEKTVSIGQYETIDVREVLDNAEEVTAYMRSLLDSKGWDTVVLIVTDIMREGSEIIAVGDTAPVARGLGVDLSSGSVWMDGIMSRKKQVAAPIVDAAGK
jgi:manganese-dependent inorganic pyrophosphatase